MTKNKEIKKKKLLYRLKYRGIKELDILFERFSSKYFHNINDVDLDELNSLLEVPDQDLLDFILNKKETPSNLKNKTFYRLQSFK